MTTPRNLVSYRLRRSQQALVEAKVMADLGHWNTCVNRLYYACFYATSALLASRGLAASKHTGVRSALHRHFIRTGLIPVDLGRWYDNLFETRQEGDYDDFVDLQEDDVRPWIEVAERFIRLVEQLLVQKDPPGGSSRQAG